MCRNSKIPIRDLVSGRQSRDTHTYTTSPARKREGGRSNSKKNKSGPNSLALNGYRIKPISWLWQPRSFRNWSPPTYLYSIQNFHLLAKISLPYTLPFQKHSPFSIVCPTFPRSVVHRHGVLSSPFSLPSKQVRLTYSGIWSLELFQVPRQFECAAHVKIIYLASVHFYFCDSLPRTIPHHLQQTELINRRDLSIHSLLHPVDVYYVSSCARHSYFYIWPPPSSSCPPSA